MQGTTRRRRPDRVGTLDAARRAYAAERGFADAEIADMHADFVDYFTVGPGHCWDDWDRAWQGWVRREARFGRRRPAAPRAASSPLMLAAMTAVARRGAR